MDMRFLGRLKPLWLIGAFAVGMLFCYLYAPKVRMVVKFPSPYNAGRVVYRDSTDTCFVYDAEKGDCPADGEGVKPQPLNLEEDFGQRQASSIEPRVQNDVRRVL